MEQLQLEVGKTYVNHLGDTAEIIEALNPSNQFYNGLGARFVDSKERYYKANGERISAKPIKQYDLVEEISFNNEKSLPTIQLRLNGRYQRRDGIMVKITHILTGGESSNSLKTLHLKGYVFGSNENDHYRISGEYDVDGETSLDIIKAVLTKYLIQHPKMKYPRIIEALDPVSAVELFNQNNWDYEGDVSSVHELVDVTPS